MMPLQMMERLRQFEAAVELEAEAQVQLLLVMEVEAVREAEQKRFQSVPA